LVLLNCTSLLTQYVVIGLIDCDISPFRLKAAVKDAEERYEKMEKRLQAKIDATVTELEEQRKVATEAAGEAKQLQERIEKSAEEYSRT
jgi:hypothetical protein